MANPIQHKIALDYWLEKALRFDPLDLASTRTKNSTGSKSRQSFSVPEATAASLKQVCSNKDAGIYAFIATALHVLVHKYTGAGEVLLTSAAIGSSAEEAPLFLAASIQREDQVKTLLTSLQKEIQEAYHHRNYDFQKFEEKFHALRGSKELPSPLSFSYPPFTGEDFSTQHKLAFTFRKNGQSFGLDIEHSDVYADWFIAQLGRHFLRILQFICQHPATNIAAIPLLSDQEKELIVGSFNETTVVFPEKDTHVIELFEKQAKAHPDQPAVQFDNRIMSYRELQQKCLQLATRLRAAGAGRANIVALICDRSEHMITGMLAILKAGAAYLPVDAELPGDRIQYLLEDSAAPLILTTRSVYAEKQAFFQDYEDKVILIDDLQEETKLTDLPTNTRPEDPAYLIYTSGSTGRPKGVPVIQSGFTNFILAYKSVFRRGFDTSDRVLAVSNISFDASIAEIFVALTSGSTLVILDKERLLDAAKLAAFIKEENISYAYIPPVLLKDLYTQLSLLEPPTHFRKLFTGVEAIKDDVLYGYSTFIKDLDIINAYGPTETTVMASILNYVPEPPTGENVSIGRPIANCGVYILNEYNEPAPLGVAGELCITGAGLTPGYLNNDELTASRFVPDPFHEGTKMYRSGDLAQWTPEGNILFTGRKDNQVKIRGYRIEPGEIEAVMSNHPAVKEAVVCAFDDETGSKYLCAYFVSAAAVTIPDLRGYLAEHLPDYMIPARFMALESIPVTANGKTDRKRLPQPGAAERILTDADMPSGKVEEKLLLTWKELLNAQTLGVNDNFFESGGHSLKAAKLITIILRDFKVEVPLRKVFSCNTVRLLADYIQHAEQSQQFEIPLAPNADHYPASFPQSGIYLSYLLNKNAVNYNMPTALAVEGPLDLARLEDAFHKIIERHAILRTGFSFAEDRILQHVREVVPFEIALVPADDADTRQVLLDQVRPFDLAQPPLLRAAFIQQGPDKGILFFDLHHIVSDGFSADILTRELIACYHAESLPPLKIQYKDYAAWLDQYRQTPAFADNRQYWLELFRDKPAALDLPIDFPRTDEKMLDGGIHKFTIGKEMTAQLREAVHKEESTLFLLTMAAYQVLLAKWTGKTDIVVGTPVAGRVHPDLDNLIGMFVHTIPVKSRVDMQQTFSRVLAQLRDTFFESLDHQLYPMEELVEELELERDQHKNPLFDTLFAYQNITLQPLQIKGLTLRPVSLVEDNASIKFDLTVDVTETDEELLVFFNYSTNLFRESTIERMMDDYLSILRIVAQAPAHLLDDIQLSEQKEGRIPENKQELFRYLGIDETIYESAFPITTTQRDIYLTSVLAPEDSSMRLLVYFDLKEDIDAAQWEKAIARVTQSEDTMRSELILKEGAIFQAVRQEVEPLFRYLDLSKEVKEPGDIHALIEKYCGDNHDIGKPAFKHYLFRVGAQHYITATSAHHLYTDGLSCKLLLEKTDQAYHELKEGRASIAGISANYEQYVSLHRQQFDTARTKEFWEQRLANVQPLSYSGALAQEDKTIADTLLLASASADQVMKYCRENNIKEHVFFKAVFVLLAKYYCNADHDFCIRENIAGRSRQYLNTIGVFSHCFPLLVEQGFFDSGRSFKEFCTYLQQQKNFAHEHRHISLSLQNRLIGDEPLSFFYNYQHFIVPDTKTETGPLQQVYHILNSQLELKVKEQEAAFEISLDYNERIFNGRHFLERFQQLLTQVLEHKPLPELQYLQEEEWQQLLAFGKNTGSKAGKNFLELFEEQAQQKPGNTALVFRDKAITYAELDRASDAVAAHLQQLGVGAEDIVAIMVERSEWMITGLLGILKAGAAYLPVDPEYPKERIDYLLRDSQAKIVLTHTAWQQDYPGSVAIEAAATGTVKPNKTTIRPEQLAYVIYTSGTTGQPKGVMMEHRSLSNIARAWREAYQLDTFEVCLLQMASFSFDVFTGDVVRTLSNGGRMIICPSETRLDTASLYELMHTHRINILESTPALLVPLMDHVYEHKKDIGFLKLLILGSDVCPAAHFRKLSERFAPGVRVINSYGVTETCIDAGFYEAPLQAIRTKGNTPIGRPMSNYTYYVCNAAHQPVPVGQPGELWIGGEGLARGYLRKPEISADKFISLPLTQERVYRTGDVVRWLPDGNLEFSGRKDDQVKLRGYRIELQEIEAALLRQESVREAVVTVYGQGDDKELVAWYSTGNGKAIENIRALLKQQLPEYMIPTYCIMLEKLPLTPNGKIDRKALPDLLQYTEQHTVMQEAPANEAEHTLLAIWQNILKRTQIGVTDNFFELGGQSLKAMVLLSRIQKAFSVEISLKDIFTHPTIRSLAAHLEHAASGQFASIARVVKQDCYPLSSAQKRLYVICHFKGAEISYNMYAAFWIEGALDTARLEHAFQQLVDRHEILRTAFTIVNDEPVQVIRDKVDFRLKHNKAPETEATAVVERFIRKFDLGTAPLLRAEILEVTTDRHLLMYDIHHIISDGVSMQVFLKELMELYQGKKLPELNLQYKDYTAWQHSQFHTGAMDRQKQFWEQQFATVPPVLDLPTDFARPLTPTFEGENYLLDLDAGLAARIADFIAERKVTYNMFLLSVYNILLAKYSSQEDIVIGTAVAGRTHADLEPLIGMFVNTLALRNYPQSDKTFEQFLQEVKTNAVNAYSHQDYPFEELVDSLNLKRDTSRNPLFDVMFLFADNTGSKEDFTPPEWRVRPFSTPGSIAKMDLIFEASRTAEKISFLFNYNTSIFSAATIQRLATHYLHVVDQVLAQPAVPLRDVFLPDKHEQQLLQTFGGIPEKYAPGISIPMCWKQQAQQLASEPAVITSNGSLSFAELDERSDALASYLLHAYAIQPGDRIAVMQHRTKELMISLLAILKTGGAYVPVDPLFPAQRIAYILDNSESRLVITDKKHKDIALPILNIREAEAEIMNAPPLPEISIAGSDLAYLIYTSGSTGNPKGVMMDHGNVVSLSRNLEPVFGIRPKDRLLALANVTFDMSILDLLCSFVSGVCIVLAADEEVNDFDQIATLLREQQVTVLQSTPSRLSMLFDTVGPDSIAGLKALLVGGEAMTDKLFQVLRQCNGTRVFNTYGPTETCVWSTAEEIKDDRINIGKPLAGEQILILSADGQLQPVNVSGEIGIAGSGLGRGYCGNAAMTAEKFIRNEALSPERIYRTGDLGKWLPDGRIEYIGRMDNQVKLRGYRIELGEIENALARMEGVEMAAAVITEVNGEKEIAVFYECDREYSYSTVRAFLADRLPAYMLPLLCIYLEKMPFTSSGKIDRIGLEQLALKQQAATRPFEEPTGELQRKVAAIWKEILRIDTVSAADNFFEIGGNSIKLIQVLNKIRKDLEVSIPLTTAFTYPTVKELSGKIKMILEYGNVSAEDFYSVANPGKKQTIFCFPPAIGYSFVYTALAEYLPDYSICCFHYIEGDDKAAQYLEVINQLQGDQPLLLLGYSAGGNFALEMARAFEDDGREVSDIFFIDSYKRWQAETQTDAQMEETIRSYFESIDWSVFSVEESYLETIRKNTFEKISGYCRYRDGQVDTSRTNARIHLLRSVEDQDKPEVNRNWEDNTHAGFYVHQGMGIHMEMLHSEHIAGNMGILANVLKQMAAVPNVAFENVSV